MSDEPGPSRRACTFTSPMKKRQKLSPMRNAEKETVINVFKYVEETWPKDSYPYKTEIVKKTAEIVGISRATVYRFLNEKKATGRLQSPPPTGRKLSFVDNIDDFDLGAIRRKVHMFFFNKELPTVDKVLAAVNEDDMLPNFKRTTFYKILKKMQFNYVKRNRMSALTDRDDIIVWRRNYLKTIRQLRDEGRKIYYTDETWLNEGHTMNKVWKDDTVESSKDAFQKGLSTGLKNPSGKGKRLIILHIGSNSGFLEGGELIFEAKKCERDYHSEMDSHNFEKWFSEILPKLEQNSVVVMDNAPYHSRRKEKIPTSANKKCELQAWLKEKNISFDENDVKAELCLKISKVRDQYQRYVVDEMAQEKGITVVRLPPYHCELNPIELIWAQVKGYVAKNNKSFKLKEIKSLLTDALQNVTAEAWAKCIDHVIKEEEKLIKIDPLMDEIIDKFEIFVNESSSESQ